MPCVIEIRPLSTEISHHAKQMLVDGQQTERQPDSIPKNITTLPRMVGRCIKFVYYNLYIKMRSVIYTVSGKQTKMFLITFSTRLGRFG